MEPESKNITCPKCGGAGITGQESKAINYKSSIQNKKIQFDMSFEFTIICPKCKGEGKVDWISNIVGSKELVITSIQGVSKWRKLY